LKLLNLPYFSPRRHSVVAKKRLPLTGDQRKNNKPEFIHQPGIE